MLQKATSSSPASIFRAAFDRLSFRTGRKKEIKYDLVIQKQGSQNDKNEAEHLDQGASTCS